MEPNVQGVQAKLVLSDSGRELCCVSNIDGVCAFQNVPVGQHTLVILNEADSMYSYQNSDGELVEFPGSHFMFRNVPKGWKDIPAYDIDGAHVPDQRIPLIEEHYIQEPISVYVSRASSTLDVPIMMGLFFSPLDHRTSQWLWNHVDLDYNVGSVRNYLGDTTGCHGSLDPSTPLEQRTTGTCDNHQGNDFIAYNGSPVYAMANGVVLRARDERWGNPPDVVWLVHNTSGFGSEPCLVTFYCHNDSVLVRTGDIVSGGQLIALSGDQVNSHPHLHANAWIIPREYCSTDYNVVGGYLEFVRQKIPFGSGLNPVADDFWRDVLNPDSVSYWTMDNVRASPLSAELPALTPTPPPPLAEHSLEVRLFFDCNGSAEWDVACRPDYPLMMEYPDRFLPPNPAVVDDIQTFQDEFGNVCGEEPPLVGLPVVLINSATGAQYEAISDSDGRVAFDDLPTGNYALVVSNRTEEAKHQFRYVNLSSSDFAEIGELREINLNGNMQIGYALMQGYLTLPWAPRDSELCVGDWFDFLGVYNEDGTLQRGNPVMNWFGGTQYAGFWVPDGGRGYPRCHNEGLGPCCTGPHVAFGADGSQCPVEIFAAAPGRVQWTGRITQQLGGGMHTIQEDLRYLDYSHICSYTLLGGGNDGPPVARGQKLGELWCDWAYDASGPHLTLEMRGIADVEEGRRVPGWIIGILPLYSPIWDESVVPHTVRGPGPILSWWTVWNQPFFAAHYFE